MKVYRLKKFIDRNWKEYTKKNIASISSPSHPVYQLQAFYDSLIDSLNVKLKTSRLTAAQFYELAIISLGNTEFGFSDKVFTELRTKLKIDSLKSILKNKYFNYADDELLDKVIDINGLNVPLNKLEIQNLLSLTSLDPLLSVIYLINRQTEVNPYLSIILAKSNLEDLHQALHELKGVSLQNFPHFAKFIAHPQSRTMANVFCNILHTVGQARWYQALCHKNPQEILIATEHLKNASLNEDSDYIDAILKHDYPVKLAIAFCYMSKRNLLKPATRQMLINHPDPDTLACELWQKHCFPDKNKNISPTSSLFNVVKKSRLAEESSVLKIKRASHK